MIKIGNRVREVGSKDIIYEIESIKRRYFNINLSYQEYNVIVIRNGNEVREIPDFIFKLEFEIVK